MKHVFLCFVLLFLGSTTAVWGETLSELQQRAESGDSDAQYDLAMRYWEGKEGAPKDDSKAFYWAKKAAEQGNAYAQSWVGYFYENAYGTARDFGEAAYWYRRSADQGNRFSQNNLGECYYYGRGVERSYEKAVLWYKKAADQEFPSACYNLGWCYENGEGVASNRSLAISYSQRRPRRHPLLRHRRARMSTPRRWPMPSRESMCRSMCWGSSILTMGTTSKPCTGGVKPQNRDMAKPR